MKIADKSLKILYPEKLAKTRRKNKYEKIYEKVFISGEWFYIVHDLAFDGGFDFSKEEIKLNDLGDLKIKYLNIGYF